MATIKPTTVPSKRLASSITASSTSIQLNDILGWDGVALTAADFGTKLYAVLRNDTNTAMEIIELDPSTIASASITVNKRGLKFDGTLDTEVSANKLTWIKNETIVELGTDVPQLLQHFVRTINSPQIIDLLQYSTELTPLDNKDIPTKKYVDDLVNGGAVSINRVVVAGNAGETVAAGDPVYLDETDNEWKLCDADTAATVNNVLLGIAQGAGTNGNSITGGVLLHGVETNQSGLTAGDIVYISNTTGTVNSGTPGTTERAIGIVLPGSTTSFYFDPYFYNHITKNQKDALAGSTGTPSSSNKFVTEENRVFSPVGAVIPFAGSSAPTGWLLCDGSAVSRTTYSALFAIIADTYGPGDGSTTFNLPDLKGRAVVGYSASATTVVLEDCEDAWNESAGAGVSADTDNADFKVGSNSARFTIGSGLGANAIIATEVISSTNLNLYSYVHFWIKSSIATASDDLQLLLDNTGSCASPLETLTIPALPANTWVRCRLALSAPTADRAIISIGLKQTTDLGAFTLRIDDVRLSTFNELGAVGGEISHTLTTNEMPAHTHTYATVGSSDTGGGATAHGTSAGASQNPATSSAGDGEAHTNLQPYITLNYIIKT